MFPTETAPKQQKKEEKKNDAPTTVTQKHEPTLSHTKEYTNHVGFKHASNILMLLQLFMLILFARCAVIDGDYSKLSGNITNGYFYFGGVEIMM